jgi:glycogen operon protein
MISNHRLRKVKFRREIPSRLEAPTNKEGGQFCFVQLSRNRCSPGVYQHSGDSSPARIIDLDPMRHRTGDIWHVWVRGIAVGQLYGYRIEGPHEPEEGQMKISTNPTGPQ